jgi:hypothetical protein
VEGLVGPLVGGAEKAIAFCARSSSRFHSVRTLVEAVSSGAFPRRQCLSACRAMNAMPASSSAKPATAHCNWTQRDRARAGTVDWRRAVGRRRLPPSQNWRTSLRNHIGQIVAADFFVVPTATYRLLFVLDIF